MTTLKQYRQIEKDRDRLIKDTINISFKERMKIKREYTNQMYMLLIEEKRNNKNICKTLDKLFYEMLRGINKNYTMTIETRDELFKWSREK